MGTFLNLKKPKTFQEKIQWLKLYDRKQEYSIMVDKYRVKDYVASIIGEKYIIPTIGLWDSLEEIDWEKLPNNFVIKTTHGGGGSGTIICRDKDLMNKVEVLRKLKSSLQQDIYTLYREWPYKNVPKRIIAEKLIEAKELIDYKWYCFNGKPTYCQVIKDRHTNETIDFYDSEWNHLEFVGLNPVALNSDIPTARPVYLDKMVEISAKLSAGTKFMRVDLYEIHECIYFGEITFYPASGLGVFRPDKYNEIMGRMIDLDTE